MLTGNSRHAQANRLVAILFGDYMNDSAMPLDGSAPMNLSVEAQPGAVGADLEQRVQRLEEEIDALKDTKALEERVVERVTERLRKEAGSDRFTATPPSQPVLGPASSYWDQAAAGARRTRHAWLLYDLFADARLIVVMLFDRRYALAWTTHLVVWLFIPAILTSWWWFPPAWIPILGHFLDKLFDLLLAFCVYKALSREARHYRELLDQRL
jgi:hypothetical protein